MQDFQATAFLLLISLYLTAETQGLSCFKCMHSDIIHDGPGYDKSCRAGSFPDKKFIQTCSTGDGTRRLKSICAQTFFEIVEEGKRHQVVDRKCEYLLEDAKMINGCVNRSKEEHKKQKYLDDDLYEDKENLNWIQICSCDKDQCNGKWTSAKGSPPHVPTTIALILTTATLVLSIKDLL